MYEPSRRRRVGGEEGAEGRDDERRGADTKGRLVGLVHSSSLYVRLVTHHSLRAGGLRP